MRLCDHEGHWRQGDLQGRDQSGLVKSPGGSSPRPGRPAADSRLPSLSRRPTSPRCSASLAGHWARKTSGLSRCASCMFAGEALREITGRSSYGRKEGRVSRRARLAGEDRTPARLASRGARGASAERPPAKVAVVPPRGSSRARRDSVAIAATVPAVRTTRQRASSKNLRWKRTQAWVRPWRAATASTCSRVTAPASRRARMRVRSFGRPVARAITARWTASTTRNGSPSKSTDSAAVNAAFVSSSNTGKN
jgi:hypothetical protein